MNHEPVSLLVGWLNSVAGLSSNPPRVSSLIAEQAALPAVAVVNATGGPLADASGLDTVYDWTATIYCVAGRTGAGLDYPDYQAAAQLAGYIVGAARAVAGGAHYVAASGARLIDAEIIAMTRSVDDAGNAIVTLTVDVRVSD